MAQGCRASFQTSHSDLRKLRLQCQGALRAAGFRCRTLRMAPQDFRLEGVHGHALLSMLPGLHELVAAVFHSLGILSLVKALVRGWSIGDVTRLHLAVVPWKEILDEPETFLSGQSLAEFVGDHYQSRRLFERLVEEFRRRGLIVNSRQR